MVTVRYIDFQSNTGREKEAQATRERFSHHLQHLERIQPD